MRKLGILPKTATVRTARGKHYWFEGTLIGRVRKLEGIDIKTNGYVVAPPSRHVRGVRYKWI